MVGGRGYEQWLLVVVVGSFQWLMVIVVVSWWW